MFTTPVDARLIDTYAPTPRTRAMLRAAFAGGDVALRAFHRHDAGELVIKKARDFQTEADRASERAIAAALAAAFPGAAIHGEEGEADIDRPAAVRFLIDPIDGTTNFAWGIPFFAAAIALEENDAVTAGVVLDPVHGEAFVAEDGKGSFLNGTRLKMNDTVAPEASIIGASLPVPGQVKSVPVETYFAALRAVIDTASGVRRLGSAALSLCYVAAGRHDAFFEDGLSPLDYAAAALVVREAGGIVTGFDGGAVGASGAILAAVRGLHPWLLARFVG